MKKVFSLVLGFFYCTLVGGFILAIIIAGGQLFTHTDSSVVARLITVAVALYLGYLTIYIPYWFDMNYKERETKPAKKTWDKIIEERFKI